jgi:hypothetical protein
MFPESHRLIDGKAVWAILPTDFQECRRLLSWWRAPQTFERTSEEGEQ